MKDIRFDPEYTVLDLTTKGNKRNSVAIPRSFALNFLRTNGEKNIADALWCNALDFNRVLNYHFKQLALNSPAGICNI